MYISDSDDSTISSHSSRRRGTQRTRDQKSKDYNETESQVRHRIRGKQKKKSSVLDDLVAEMGLNSLKQMEDELEALLEGQELKEANAKKADAQDLLVNTDILVPNSISSSQSAKLPYDPRVIMNDFDDDDEYDYSSARDGTSYASRSRHKSTRKKKDRRSPGKSPRSSED